MSCRLSVNSFNFSWSDLSCRLSVNSFNFSWSDLSCRLSVNMRETFKTSVMSVPRRLWDQLLRTLKFKSPNEAFGNIFLSSWSTFRTIWVQIWGADEINIFKHQTTGKQRAPEMIQNKWKKRNNEKWKMESHVYAWFDKSEILVKVPVNRKTEKSTKTLILISHCWEAFTNLIAGSLCCAVLKISQKYIATLPCWPADVV